MSGYVKWDRTAYVDRVGGTEEAERRRKAVIATANWPRSKPSPATSRPSAAGSTSPPGSATAPQPRPPTKQPDAATLAGRDPESQAQP